MDVMRLLFSGEKGNRAPIFDWLPMGLLVIFALVLYWSEVSFAQPPNVSLIVDQAKELSGTQLALLILMVPIVAIFLQPMQDFLIRLQEGNWPSSLASLSRLLCRWHIHRVRRLIQSIDRQFSSNANPRPFTQLLTEVQQYPRHRLERLRQFFDYKIEGDAPREALIQAILKIEQYPNESHMMPTRLGNVLRANEDSAGQRYGFSTVDVWPRLYQVLPQRLIDSASDARNELELALRFSGTFFLAGTFSFVLMFQHGLWLLVPIVWLLSAWLSYQTAIRAATKYGEAVKLAFDIHRFDLLRALRVPLPANADQELIVNQRLSEFVAVLSGHTFRVST